ncbi:MAG: hypothetical protein JWO91_2211 [Acidobacteriaceae bacterium]|nr:hypothetical protein [Acidobacteriaceae bacterium]
MYYIGVDVHKKTFNYCVKDASGQVEQEGKVDAMGTGRLDEDSSSAMDHQRVQRFSLPTMPQSWPLGHGEQS